MMTTTSTSPRGGIKPREHAPELAVDLVGGGRWRLDEQQPETFTMVVFYRGLHCPVCRAQLSELNRRLDDLTGRGITVIAISGDTRERAERTVAEWHLDRLTIGYGLSEETARAFGLFLSRAIKDDEPARFSEPGLFLIRPDGTVYYEAINSMPLGRPHLDDVISMIDAAKADYPARGEA
ncbi:MAG TPA: peroxiredoxin-like family protein [Gaiellaceae bacterium]|nr:peroxiredoxin-like family protein [Gaiellaceae bacterium]